jgi:hypothetical protein
MYGALWRAIPGPWWFKLFILLLLAAGVFLALMTWFFPEVMAPLMPFNDGTLTNETPTSTPTVSTP